MRYFAELFPDDGALPELPSLSNDHALIINQEPLSKLLHDN